MRLGEYLRCEQEHLNVRTFAIFASDAGVPTARIVAAKRVVTVRRNVQIHNMRSSHVLTSADTHARIDAARDDILAFGVQRLALFGSVLRSEAGPDSDVDFLVEFAPGQKSFDRFMGLVELLETLLEHRVELVTTESLSPFIGPHILAEAVNVVVADS